MSRIDELTTYIKAKFPDGDNQVIFSDCPYDLIKLEVAFMGIDIHILSTDSLKLAEYVYVLCDVNAIQDYVLEIVGKANELCFIATDFWKFDKSIVSYIFNLKDFQKPKVLLFVKDTM